MIDELDDGNELVGRALELQALESAGVVSPEYTSQRLNLITATMQLLVAARRRRWLELIRDAWKFDEDDEG